MADDILQIFSNFDGRFSREKLTDLDDPRPSAPLQISLKSLDGYISQYVASDHPIWADSADSTAFLDSIDELVATIREWTPVATADKSVAACLVRADELLQQSMFRLEDEFRSLMERGAESFELSESTGNLSFDSDDDRDDDEGGVIGNGEEHHQIPVAPPISEYNIIIDALPSGTINDLNEIVKRMVTAGFGKECSHMYSSCRREFLEESMSRLRLQKLSIDEVHKMPWQEVEEQIERWVKAANLALRILFPSERRLCDHVFFGLSSAADLSFMEVCHGSSIQLLNFADAISIGSRSPERLFKVLDVFETLRDLMPEFELVFSDQYCLILRNEAMTIWKRLGEAIRGIFMELENLIRQDPAKAAVPGGGLHPITRYVMNYLRAACRSRQTLEQIFEKDSSSSLSVQMSWIMELLQSNLEVKSKIYRDPALCSIFMMNNGRYIVQKVNDSELDLLLGDDWIRKHNAKIRQYHSNYQKSSWNKILGILKLENSSSSAPNAAAAARSMKEKLKLFNLSFDEICKTQFPWAVFDEQFREELKTSVTKILLPAYGNFIGKLQNIPEMGKHPDRLIKYRVEDIEARINELFQGNGSPAGCGRK
ncbi:hypothetical protein EZV62_027991 [Acer yangbiense]|uniref:Exocyst subunit Exo70 family protein n=1 Tax=Acer yangbiense TaxID=1000413 RepID=A0A5C7GNW4_9ROSI|nr:hypothetical protein EZV62_027991 [Acer yangbiense]